MAWSVEEHVAHVRELVGPAIGGTETVGLLGALGRVTASAVLSPVELPLFRNSQMDGFAVRVADLASGRPLPVVATLPARALSPAPLPEGAAMRIMTGAVVPEGADAVIPVEDTTVTAEQVTIATPRRVGEYVRELGSDVHIGDELLPARLRLASRHLAVVAAAGLTSVEVARRPRIAIITTGSELVQPGTAPLLGQVFDANSVAVQAAVAAAGGEVVLTARVTDDATAMTEAVAAATVADVIVTSGGISMGDYEVVRDALEPLGARVGRVAMQPGGPQATAVVDGTPVLCFPGNPVSTQLSFELFLAPLLREAAGLPAAIVASKTLAHDVRSVPGKRQFLRGRARGGERVETVSGPGSHLVAGLAASDLLIIVPEETTELREGDTVETIAL